MEIFVVNVFLYVVLFLWALRNKKDCSAFYIFSGLMYAVVACMGVYIFNENIYQNEIPDHRGLECLSYTPFFLMFVMMLVVFWPLKTIPKFELEWSDRRVNWFSNIAVLLIVSHMFFWLYGFQLDAASDLGDAYHMSVSGDLALQYSSDGEVIISKILRRLSLCITPIFFYLQFYRFSKSAKIGAAVVYLCMGIFASVVPAILQGSRGSLFFTLFSLIYVYTVFKDEIPLKTKKKLYGLFAVVIVTMSFYVVVISVMRSKGDSEGAIIKIFRYFGEPFLNLGLVYWNSTDVHTYGIRYFPKLLELYGGFELPESKYGVDALREFWTRIYGVNMYYFKTFFGDLYMEFGVVGAFIVSALTATGAWLSKKLKNPLLCHFILYYYAKNVVIWGIFGFGVTQNVCVDLAYALVFWYIFSKFWNPVKKEEDGEKEEKKSG